MPIELLRQLGFPAQGQGFDNWENFILLVIMLVFWLVGVVGKIITGKKGGQTPQRRERSETQPSRPRETWQQRLARKAREMQQAAEAERARMEQQARARTQASKPRPAGEITVRTDRKGDSVMVYEPPAAGREQQIVRRPEPRASAVATGSQALLEPSTPLVSADASSRQPASSSSSGEVPPLVVMDYGDPDALKKAILHYEIFGKPLALRETSQEADAF